LKYISSPYINCRVLIISVHAQCVYVYIFRLHTDYFNVQHKCVGVSDKDELHRRSGGSQSRSEILEEDKICTLTADLTLMYVSVVTTSTELSTLSDNARLTGPVPGSSLCVCLYYRGLSSILQTGDP
jgi:hypothetical protein